MPEIKGVSGDSHFIDFIEEMKAANLFYKEDLAIAEIDETLLAVIPETLAVRYHILPVSRADERLVLVTDTHQTYKDRAEVEKELGETIKLILTTEENLRAGLLRFYQIKSFKHYPVPEEVSWTRQTVRCVVPSYPCCNQLRGVVRRISIFCRILAVFMFDSVFMGIYMM